MNAQEFKDKLDTSIGLQLIVAGLANLVESEKRSPHEAFAMLEDVKQNTFYALGEIGSESK